MSALINSDISDLLGESKKSTMATLDDCTQNQASQKYTTETRIDEIQSAFIYDGVRQGLNEVSNSGFHTYLFNQDFVREKVNRVLTLAQSDAYIMKGLIQYLNWQDNQPKRLEIPKTCGTKNW